jgi:hypothetical protein
MREILPLLSSEQIEPVEYVGEVSGFSIREVRVANGA